MFEREMGNNYIKTAIITIRKCRMKGLIMGENCSINKISDQVRHFNFVVNCLMRKKRLGCKK
jgi:hypothetical protein